MNTIHAQLPLLTRNFANGGDYVTEGMGHMQQLSAGAIAPAA
jgi:hypothetical protein